MIWDFGGDRHYQLRWEYMDLVAYRQLVATILKVDQRRDVLNCAVLQRLCIVSDGVKPLWGAILILSKPIEQRC